MPRRQNVLTFIPALSLLLLATPLGALEKPTYEILEEDGETQLRRYDSYVVAETRVAGEYEEASDEAFMRLFGYISGKNRRQIEPNAPKIAMTAPVTTVRDGNGWRMAFMVPGSYTLETAPPPADRRVTLRAEPGGLMAAFTYTGRSTRERYLKREAELRRHLEQRGYEVAGAPMFAGYDAPFVPGLLRRNEVLIPLAAETRIASATAVEAN